MAKKIIIFLLILVILIISGFLLFRLYSQSAGIISPLEQFRIKPLPIPKPLEKYSFNNLKERGGQAGEIKIIKILESKDKFTSNLFSYQSQGRNISGLANIPNSERELKFAATKDTKFPVIVMLRGYVDREIYETGVGTQHAGEYFSQNGFITLAPDFLGYGESDMPPNNVWEERFLRLTSVMDLLASIKNLPKADSEKIGIWSHSNGGLTALSILEISGGKYPTTLWAPVSQNFPYDILYYTYEYDDQGKALRKSLADFEKEYDVNQYSFTEYLNWIKAPIQVHQGTSDEYIPLWWTNSLVEKLKKLDNDISLYIYPGADHNLKGGWETVVQRDIQFFRKTLQ